MLMTSHKGTILIGLFSTLFCKSPQFLLTLLCRDWHLSFSNKAQEEESFSLKVTHSL